MRSCVPAFLRSCVPAFLRYAAAHPLKGRGAQARRANVRKFLDAVHAAGIAVTTRDWERAIKRAGASA
jgi:hypothetical protein